MSILLLVYDNKIELPARISYNIPLAEPIYIYSSIPAIEVALKLISLKN